MRVSVVAALGIPLALLAGWLVWRTLPTAAAEGLANDALADSAVSAASQGVPAPATRSAGLAREDRGPVSPGGQGPEEPGSPTGSLLVRLVFVEDGTPAPEVLVRVAERSGRSPGPVREARSDAAGLARFAPLRPGRVRVATDRFEPAQEVVVEAAAETSIVLRTARGHDVDGIVVDTRDQPIADAEIWTVAPPDLRPPRPAGHSDARGEFRLRALAPGTLVGARARGGLASDFVRGVADRERRIALRLVARSDAAELGGRVVDGAGEVVAAARVHVRLLGRGASASERPDGSRAFRLEEYAEATNAEGRFTLLGLPPGRWSLAVTDGVHAPFAREIDLEAGRRTECDVALQPGASLRGTVRGEDGAPVEGVKVRVEEEGERDDDRLGARETGRDGRYAIAGLPPGTVHACAFAVGMERASAELVLSADGVTTWDPVLRAKAGLAGKVVDPSGAAIPGCKVLASSVVHWQEGGGQGVADEKGEFAIAVPPGGRFRFRVIERDAAFPIECEEAGEHASGERDIVLVLRDQGRARASIGGVLVDADRRPIPLRTVVLSDGPYSPYLDNRATGDGAFRFVRLPARKYWVDLWPADPKLERIRLGPYELAPGEAKELGEVPVPRTGRLVLVLARRDGAPLEQVSVETTPKDGGAAFHLDGVPPRAGGHALAPGEYETTLFGDGFVDVERLPFTIRAGEVTKLEVVLEPAVRRDVRFPVPEPPGWTESTRAKVTLRRVGGGTIFEDEILVRRNQPERFAPALGLGSYEVVIEAERGRRYAGRFRIETLVPSKAAIDVAVSELR